MNNEIDALDFISMLVERKSLEREIDVSFNRINKLREALLSENLPHDLGFYDFEVIEEFYPENVKVTYDYVHIEMSDNFARIVNRRTAITKSTGYIKMFELWMD